MTIFCKTGFANNGKPFFEYITDDQVHANQLKFGSNLTIIYDTAKKFCTGWYDMTTKQRFPCEQHAVGHDQCVTCMHKTGFNPAFYNTDTISPQQDQRNHEPHALYLAYFGGDSIKVGIAHHSRKLGRLLEQGARAAIVIEQFETANVARSYEARIAKLSGFVESVRASTKITLLKQPLAAEEADAKLHAALASINRDLSTDFTGNLLHLDKFYTDKASLSTSFVDASGLQPATFSGTVIALIGSCLFFSNNDQLFMINTKNFGGNACSLTSQLVPMDLAEQQLELF